MKKYSIYCAFFLLMHVSFLHATPTSEFWTTCTTDIEDCGVIHLGIDNYFTVFQHRNRGSYFAPDIGLTAGLFDIHHWKGELGVDYIGGTADPWFFNAKIGCEENIYFNHSPSFAIGIFNIGANRRLVTDQNVLYTVLGKIIPGINVRLFVGYYHIFREFGLSRATNGFMCAIDRGFCDVTDCDGNSYKRLVLIADYQSGKNSLGGGGVGVKYFFTHNISLLTGPIWFCDTHINGRWKWSTQIDIDLPFL